MRRSTSAISASCTAEQTTKLGNGDRERNGRMGMFFDFDIANIIHVHWLVFDICFSVFLSFEVVEVVVLFVHVQYSVRQY